jgi:hypothetical protein
VILFRAYPDVVGEFKNAEICVSRMPSWKAKKPGKLTQEKVLLELWSRFANNIYPEHTPAASLWR